MTTCTVFKSLRKVSKVCYCFEVVWCNGEKAVRWIYSDFSPKHAKKDILSCTYAESARLLKATIC